MLKGLGGGLLALIVAFALVQDADAKPRTVVIDGAHQVQLDLRGSNGYRLGVSFTGRSVTVSAVGDKDGRALALYMVPRRKHGEHGFGAKLPGIGRVAVEFVPRGKAKPIPTYKGCTGRIGRRETGVFVGTIEFHGERGFTDVSATRAKGSVTRTYRQVCKLGDKKKGKGKGGEVEDGLNTAELFAANPKESVFFSASRLELDTEFGPAVLSYWASTFSEKHGMTIVRMVIADAPLTSFTAEAPGRPVAAKVEPPAPFSGSASYALAAAGSPSWTGDLSVTLPGTGPLPLAGKGFKSQLCIEKDCSGDNIGARGGESVAMIQLRRLAGRLR